MISDFTPRQKEVLRLISLGYTNMQIAENLSITYSTVKAYVRLIQTKLNVENRTQCAIVGADLLGIDSEMVFAEVRKFDALKK